MTAMTALIHNLLVLAATDGGDAGNSGKGLILMVVGMAVVFIALVVLMAVIMGIRLAFDRPPKPAAAPNFKPVAETPAAPVPADQVDPELLAVLTAAAFAVVRKPLHITRVNFLGGAGAGSSWSQQGRRTILTSHRPRRN